MGLESVFAVQAVMSLTDSITGPLGRIMGKMKDAEGGAEKLGGKMLGLAKKMAPFAVAAGIVVGGLASCVGATIETQKALGELASVGVKDMAALETAAADFSNQWAGTSKAEFITAAYDIKSGIASLTDEGVAQFTQLAALTGKATKASVAEMTKLFALGHGIFRQDFIDDRTFGDQFSAAISSAVQRFRTDGSDLASGMSTIGADAKVMGVDLAEQLAVIGMSKKSFASASEGMTSYRAFLAGAVGAQEKLGLTFTNAQGGMLPMADILDKLKSKFGDLSAEESAITLRNAFGGGEATKIINALISDTQALREQTVGLRADMNQGTEFTAKMAGTMNQDLGAVLQLTGQRWQNLKETIGNVFLPVVVPLVSGISKVVSWLGMLAGTRVGKVILIVVGVLSLAVLAVTAFSLAAAGVSYVLPLLSGALIPLIAQVLTFSMALLACPLTWIVLAVVAIGAGLYWLYNRFEFVRTGVDKLMYILGFAAGTMVKFGRTFGLAFTGPFGAIAALVLYVKSIFPSLVTWISGLAERFRVSGAALWDALVAGIKSRLMLPVEVVKSGLQKVRNLLPFSDAKEGPLSTLTLSGARMIETLSGGVKSAAPMLRTAAAGALAGVAATVGLDTGAMPVPAGYGASPAAIAAPAVTEASRPAKQSEGGRISIASLTVHLPGVADADGFVNELKRLVEQYEV